MRIIKALLVLVIVGYLGAKGFAYYKVKSEADSLIEQVAIFADVTYDGIYTDLRGEVGLEGIKVSDSIAGDEMLRIGALRLRGPNILFLLGQDLSKEFPDRLGFTIDDLQLSLDSELFTLAAAASGQQGGEGDFMLQSGLLDYTLGCGAVQTFGPSELMQMGYTELNVDLEIDTDYTEVTRTTSFRVFSATTDMGSTRLEMEVAARPSPMFFAGLASGQTPIKKITYEESDTGYYSRRNQFCARQNGESVEEYVERHIDLLARDLGTGFPDDAKEAYRQFMLNGGTMVFTAYPDDTFNITQAAYYETKDIVARLNMSVAINGQEIALNQFEWGEAGSPAQAESANTGSGDNESASEAPAYEQQYTHQQRASYHPFQLSKAGNYLNYKIKIVTTSGTEREGILRKADQSQLTIEVPNLRGNLIYNIRLRDINSAEAYY